MFYQTYQTKLPPTLMKMFYSDQPLHPWMTTHPYLYYCLYDLGEDYCSHKKNLDQQIDMSFKFISPLNVMVYLS